MKKEISEIEEKHVDEILDTINEGKEEERRQYQFRFA